MTRPQSILLYKRRELILFYESPTDKVSYIAVFRLKGRYIEEGIEPFYLETVYGGWRGGWNTRQEYMDEQARLCSRNGYVPCEEEHLFDSLRLHSLPTAYAWMNSSTTHL